MVEKPKECRNVIGTKWIFKNKQDESGIVVRNKARLLAQGFSQVEGHDEDQNDNIDRAIPPRCNAEIEARRKARNERTLIRRGHTLDKVIGDVRAKMSTRRQVGNFCEHQAHISMVPSKGL